ncbi:molecular chaperone MKKS [Nothobranchius furzeri]|uniref:MKKS centrosomal shuttling protein n=2 Tax=Nothobranchius TaxID=28779 RepID=A0A1A7ZGC4_NOTFU|nr:McKusick-Kaufman/Bardet-Biedl syndromes putative chaperonin [Nothobranchius furzeri]KAF7219718.1 McKusick-Kaufman syndrome [Nothobranchius furzeri]
MSRLVKKCPSVCTDLPLSNADVCGKLRLMMELLRSCYGPTARLKQVHNNIGGLVVTTSTSSVLLPAITSSHPLINVMKSSLLSHVHRFSDCGLFAAILCLSLVEQAKLSGVREHAVIRVNNHLLAMCISYLQQDGCSCKVSLDFCRSQNLIALARSVISSKPACVLTELESLHISRLAVHAFLLTVPCSIPGTVSLGKIVTVTIKGHSVLESAVFTGLLVDVPEDNFFDTKDSFSAPLLMVLFSASLAGDLCEVGEGVIQAHPHLDTASQILDQLLELGKQVVKDEVRVFVCQKVIHPVLQRFLRCHGVFVIERLGVALMEPLTQMTGAQPVATLHSTPPAVAYGKIRHLSVKQFGPKKLLHLQPFEESTVCTMVLCHRNETMLNELKVVSQKTEHVLRLTLREPSALLGGGCTETHLAAYIRHKCKNEVSETATGLGCSQTEYLLAVEGFCHSLEFVASSLEHDGGTSVSDLTHAHNWTFPPDILEEQMDGSVGFCGCGVVGSSSSTKWTFLKTEHPGFSPVPVVRDTPVQPSVLDSFAAKLSAFQVAVETANLALDVRYVIQDVN